MANAVVRSTYQAIETPKPRRYTAPLTQRAVCARGPSGGPERVSASGEFLGQRDDDARRAAHVAESVLVLVLGHLTDEFGAMGAQTSDRVVDAGDGKHDTPET